MSEPFVIPRASREAELAFYYSPGGWTSEGTLNGLDAAYAVDVPRIVRAEVERALRKRQEDPLGFSIAAYLAARFGEAAPEVSHLASLREVPANGTTDTPTPSAPAVADILNERLEPLSATAELTLAEPPARLTDVGYRLMSPGERAYLYALAARERTTSGAAYDHDAYVAADAACIKAARALFRV